MRIVVTDVTRMKAGKVCVAGIDPTTGICYRPQPEFTNAERTRLSLRPGTILEGNFTFSGNENPHNEDCNPCHYDIINYDHDYLMLALNRTQQPSIAAGFGVTLRSPTKCLLPEENPHRSIITIKIKRDQLPAIISDNKFRVKIIDNDSSVFNKIQINDMRYHDPPHQNDPNAQYAFHRTLIGGTPWLYLRIGLSRLFPVNDIIGYWVQINGVYPA